jgi:hypothetical protein
VRPADDRHAQLVQEHRLQEHRRNRLERRFRRLLVLYPVEHRRVHGSEMIDVLLADSLSRDAYSLDTGIQHALDVADLVSGAVRIRTRGIVRAIRRPRSPRVAVSQPSPAGTPVRDERWRDALAVVRVIAPLLLLIAALVQVVALPATGTVGG